ncbi:13769_t:CDS:2, partial [Dentiscutata erythropus]
MIIEIHSDDNNSNLKEKFDKASVIDLVSDTESLNDNNSKNEIENNIYNEIRDIEDANYNEIGNVNYNELEGPNYNNIEDIDYNDIEDIDYNDIKDTDYNNIEDANYSDIEDTSDNEINKIYSITENLRVKEIRHTIFPMEYLPTSPEGIAICYNIENWESYEAVFENMQYMTGKPIGGGEKPIWTESSTKSRQTKKIKKIENSQDLTDALAKFDLEKEKK